MRSLVLAFFVSSVGCGGGDAAGLDAGGAVDARSGDALPVPDAAADAAAESPPEPPAGLTHWLEGEPADAVVATAGPGVILMGGGPDVDAAFAWQRDRIAGGDVVVLRTSGADGYNPYLYDDIGGVDSVHTLLVDSRALADDPYVGWVLEHAEAIFMAGGDQATYVATWQGTRVEAALHGAWGRGAILGGTSAGCAVLGQFLFSAANGTVYSDEALDDPYVSYLTLDRELATVPVLAGVITDTHFAERDRMGRLFVFLARIIADGWDSSPIGLGVDEATALVVDAAGAGQVLGDGAVYLVVAPGSPPTVSAGQPLAWSDVAVHALRAGDTVTLPAGTTTVAPTLVTAAGGSLAPDPY